MRFEDDWCIAAIDLDQHEFAYYQRELKDWDLARGRIRVPHPWLPDLPLGELGKYILPYIDASKAELISQIRVDNEFAMLLALSRDEFSLTQRQKIAQRLVTKGHTGCKGLSHLVIRELIHAQYRLAARHRPDHAAAWRYALWSELAVRCYAKPVIALVA
ncbi:hypothetical protein ALON55S_08189 [Alishewanella longhuensis]